MALRILIADDVQDSVNAVAVLLRIHGHEVHAVSDGASAFKATAELEPEVVLLDLQMPGLNGLDACRAIRRQEGGQNILLIAYTGWARDVDVARALEAGFDLHLSKPLDFDDLLAALQRAPLPRSRL